MDCGPGRVGGSCFHPLLRRCHTLFFSSLQPQAYYGHHILYLLPWQFAALFQVATAVAVLHWFAKFPCYTPALGSGATYPWQLRASQACSSMQSYSALLRSALGAPLSEFSLHACSPESGADALQVLQVFCTLVCLVLVPISISHEVSQGGGLRWAGAMRIAFCSCELNRQLQVVLWYDVTHSNCKHSDTTFPVVLPASFVLPLLFLVLPDHPQHTLNQHNQHHSLRGGCGFATCSS